MRAPLRSAAAASRSCAWTEAATNSGEPGFGSRFLSSARRARFWSSREGTGKRREPASEAGSLGKPPPWPCEQHWWCPALWQVGSLFSRFRLPRWPRGARRGLAHHGNVGTPGYSYRARGQPPITQSRQGKLRGPAYNSSSDRSLRRAPGAVNATLRPPVSTRRVIDMVALLLVVPAANSTP